jgi:hypothetical protein
MHKSKTSQWDKLSLLGHGETIQPEEASEGQRWENVNIVESNVQTHKLIMVI